ncbi:type II secretion system F family protein [Streptomyces sp. MUM 2J]|uniref:type II secretion system F family protein n=1 Tax=Streptomyces sp. MUM 2J TaxID=2791987 RepID=UPI001F04D87E|nr:type II secretion system F family protein [Streptomyces sp. MUM 2J]MCH0565081.1 type II secretion system F family protein [Streptomyces sp. MUM 2J]
MTEDVVHRLGAVMGIAVVLGWLALRVQAARRRRRTRRRLAALLGLRIADAGRPRLPARGAARRWLPAVGAVGVGWVLLGGPTGIAVGLAGAAGLSWWRRRRVAADGAAGKADAVLIARRLPLAADLLAACIAAGAAPAVAAQAVGDALGGPVGDALARGAAEARLGGEPAEAWRRLAALPGAGALARLLERADTTGLPAAGPVARLAADARAGWTRTATGRARRASVAVTAPVGLCFLPAFLAVGILPVVIGLAGEVLGGGG